MPNTVLADSGERRAPPRVVVDSGGNLKQHNYCLQLGFLKAETC